VSATGHHVVSFVTITEIEISEIEKSVLVAERSRPARGEATKGQETWCAERLVICLSLKPPAQQPASTTGASSGPGREQSTPFLWVCIIDYFLLVINLTVPGDGGGLT
jgi:hypothetical protein